MTAKLIDGRNIAQTLRQRVRDEAACAPTTPALAVILVGSDPASQVYVKFKHKACEEVGIRSINHTLPADTTEATLIALVKELNADSSVHGILVQLPLPPHLNSQTVLQTIDPKKDVDGFHPINMGRLALNLPCLHPCTPKGVITLLEQTDISIMGKNAVVIGSSNIVGRPMGLELLAKRATVTICHSKTRDLGLYTREADIVVVAVGIPALIKAEHIKPGAAVIDVGMNRLDDGSLVGDVDFAGVSELAGHITPVPGGVGPMTIATLMENTVQACIDQSS
jgi:methylenetetrahydrofolate dehydrogenase (NADP+) / methenyltetrahydrofolate cyclohydrolase